MSQSADETTRDSYLETLDHDRLARMIYQLLNELWIVRDRAAVLENYLEEKNILEPGVIDAYNPTGAFSQYLESLREAMVENVVGAPYVHDLTIEDLKKIGQKWKAGNR